MSRRLSQNERLGLLPGVCGIAKVTVGRSLAVNWLLQVELLHNDTWPQVPILADNLDKFRVALLTRAISIDED